jgi:hypothetical protein
MVDHTAITIEECQSIADSSDVIFVVNPPLLTTVMGEFETDWLLQRQVIARGEYWYDQKK